MAAGLREATKIDTYVVESLTTSLQKQTLAIDCLLEGRDVLAVFLRDLERVSCCLKIFEGFVQAQLVF